MKSIDPVSRREFISGVTAATVAAPVIVLGVAFGDNGTALASMAHGTDWQVTYPPQISATNWLSSHQRLCFGVDEKSLDDVVKDGANVICGGTNAAGVG